MKVGSDYRIVLLDLDGTLSDSAPGIMHSLRLAFDELGLPWPDPATARALLGPPFWHSLPPLVGAANVDRVVQSYRRHYVDGAVMLQTHCYPGVPELLAGLAAAGIRLAVATSKAEPHACRLLAHQGLAGYFETICGDTLDGGRNSKELVIGEALRRLGGPDPGQVLMVGDRSQDVLGAAAHGIGCAGALWGYGSPTELAAAGAVELCDTPADLLALVGAAPACPDRAG
jgi:phosphoglycolate phosphatase